MTNPVYSAPLDLITTAVLELLKNAGRAVYDGAYAGDPLAPAYPYGILYRVLGGNADPTPDLDGDPQTITVAYQVTAVSNWRNQCEATGRHFRDRLLGRVSGAWAYPLAMPAGWACIDRRPDSVTPGIDQSGDTPNAIFTLPARYLLTISPA